MMRALRLNLLVLPALCAGLLACTTRTPPSADLPQQGGASEHVWPLPPETPRYRFVANLVGERDLLPPSEKATSGIVNVFKWIAGLIVGEKQYLELRRPVSGTTDAAGRIYVVDASLRAIVVFDMKNRSVLTWRVAAPGVAFKSPVGIVKDGKGGFLVTDSELGEVFRLDNEGKPVARFGKRIVTRPTGIARDPRTGTIYVTDTARDDIKIFDANGMLTDTLGAPGKEPGRFNVPTHLAFSRGELYVADTLNFRVQIFNRAGDGRLAFGRLGLFVGNMTRPKGVAVGADGQIYVVESYYDHLLIFTRDGRLLLPIGGTGRDIGKFYLPSGVWTDDAGKVYIADMFNGRVVIMQELTSVGGA